MACQLRSINRERSAKRSRSGGSQIWIGSSKHAERFEQRPRLELFRDRTATPCEDASACWGRSISDPLHKTKLKVAWDPARLAQIDRTDALSRKSHPGVEKQFGEGLCGNPLAIEHGERTFRATDSVRE